MQHLPRARGSYCGSQNRTSARLIVAELQGEVAGTEYHASAVSTPYRPHLAPRELTILGLMNRGLTDAQIAKRLGLTRAGAAASVGRIRIKFGGGTRNDVVGRARALEIISAPKSGGLQLPRGFQPRNVRLTPHLTDRERQVLDLMNLGLTNAEIAQRLDVTLPSANSYVTNVRTRIGGSTRFEVVRRARELKLVKTSAKGGLQEISLTAFQRRVLELAAQHLTNRQIGRRLRRNLDAVTDALKYARKKLAVKTTVEAIDRAVDLGLLSIPKQKDAPNPFSARECEILDGLFAGLMHREIADALGITIGNVGGRIQQMKSKVRARNIEELLDEVERLRLYVPRRPRKQLVARETLSKRRSVSYGIQVFTPRQIDVIEAFTRRPKALLPEIASELGISPNTLQGHLTNIRQRLGVNKSCDVAEEAFKLGIVRMRRRST